MKMRLYLFLALLSLFVLPGFASSSDKTKYYELGFQERVRFEYLDNNYDFNDDSNDVNNEYFRLRTSVWGKLNPTDEISLYLRIVGEPRVYMADHAGRNLQRDEFVVDNAYFDLNKPFDLPVNFRVGRQDLKYGDGLVVVEGTPNDGSRTFYFNALKASIQINEKNSLDAVLLNNQEYDTFFPVINNRHMKLNTSDEWGFILYGTSKVSKELTLEPYYIFKQEDSFKKTPLLNIHTLGTRAVYKKNDWAIRAELAGQTGGYSDNNDRSGWAGTLFVDKSFKNLPLKPEVTAGVGLLSGDNPSTSKVEGWDPLFSRYPMYSEILLANYLTETGIIGYYTNLQCYRLATKLNVTDKTAVTLRYNYFRSFEDTLGNNGYSRGHNPQIQVNHKFNKNWDTTLLLEYFKPENYYGSNMDDALFIRAELQYKF